MDWEAWLSIAAPRLPGHSRTGTSTGDSDEAEELQVSAVGGLPPS